jgi:ribonuclease-3
MPQRNLDELQARIGYTFRDRSLLERALTHSSFANEHTGNRIDCNERLEFLGDSVLSLTACSYLYSTYPDLPEGRLTVLRKNVVCQRALADYGMQISLGDYLLLGKGEDRNGGRANRSIIADAFEAVLAAIYLDAGKAEVEKFLLPFIRDEIEVLKPGGFFGDFKTRLQQFVQQNEGDFLEYRTVGESGPDHRKVFEVNAMLNGNVIGRGMGSSKRAAEQKAAQDALILFGIEKE